MENTYIHDIDKIYADNGELYIISGDKAVTFDAKNLLRSLDGILYFTIKEVNKENESLRNKLKETIKNIKY
jgi:hypothetical protein